MNWQLELWTRPPNGKLLHVTFDPGEMVVFYRDARKVYGVDRLWLVASDGNWINWEVDYKWLRKYSLQVKEQAFGDTT
jgi:hypothetical protein